MVDWPKKAATRILLCILLFSLFYIPTNVFMRRGHWENYLPSSIGVQVNLSEMANSKSPFYGMLYKSEYGLPQSKVGFHPHRRQVEDWKPYLRDLLEAFTKHEETTLKKDIGTNTTKVAIVVSQKRFVKGDEFKATLKALDNEGRPKKYGGDYFRARLIQDRNSRPNGIPCHIIDNRDGTYELRAPLALEGKLLLDVELALSVEGAYYLDKKQTELGSWDRAIYATLESGEVTQCGIILDTDMSLKDTLKCDYSNPRNDEPWTCLAPPSNKCTRIIYMVSDLTDKNPFDFKTFCQDFSCHKKLTTEENITVLPAISSMKEGTLPKCSELFKKKTEFSVSGYFERGSWKSLHCNNLRKLPTFDNRIVYFFGDSTIRQFYYWFQQKFKLRDRGPDNSRVWQQPRIATSAKNLTLYYRAHGPPLKNPGPPNSRPYISDSIAGIPKGGQGVYVVFNIGAHLMNYDPSVFLHRIKGIKTAILNHLKIFPDTRFIVRGQNAVKYPFEWNIYRFEVIFREMFSEIENAAYLNFWDITTVWELKDYHPYKEVLYEQAMLMLSYME